MGHLLHDYKPEWEQTLKDNLTKLPASLVNFMLLVIGATCLALVFISDHVIFKAAVVAWLISP
jgi:hypothetical protein